MTVCRYSFNISSSYLSQYIDPRPSSALIKCLLALANSLLEVGTSIEPAQQSDWVCRVLTLFTEELLTTMDQHPAPQDDLVYVWDIAFLQTVATSWGSQMKDVGSTLHTRMLEMLAKVCMRVTLIVDSADRTCSL